MQTSDTRQDTKGSRNGAIRTRWSGAGPLLRFALRRAGEKKLTQVAASLTFTTVLAAVPLLAVVLALFTAFPLFGKFQLALESFLAANLMPAAVSENIMLYLNLFAAQASRLTAIGSAFLVVTSIMLMMTIDEAFNEIWHVDQQRPLRQRLLVYWAILSAGPILGGASVWATTLIAQQSVGRLDELSVAGNIALSLVPMGITGLAFSALFVAVPNRKVYWKDALAGGFGTALVLTLMKWGFAFYLTHFPSYTIIYGTFATVPIFLLWIYLSWVAILLGATVAATLPLLRLRRWEENRRPGAAFVDAVLILRLLYRSRGGLPPGRSLRFLSAHLRLQYDEVLSVLNRLREIGYVAQVQDRHGDHWLLACDPNEATLGPVVDALLLDRGQPDFVQDRRLPQLLAHSLLAREPTLAATLESPETPEGEQHYPQGVI